MPDQSPIRILGIDPSTRCTGVALVEIDPERYMRQCGVQVLRWKELDALPDKGTITDRFARLRMMRADLALFLDYLADDFQIVSYEDPPQRGCDATSALNQAIGLLLGLSQFRESTIYDIHASTVKSVQGLAGAAHRSVDRSIPGAQEAKRKALKSLAVDWARSRCAFVASIRQDQDAIADAVAVALGAYNRYREEQYQVQMKSIKQGSFGLRCAPAPKKGLVPHGSIG
jgi:Holliday junction resolvasome RuvABC endonuclease subunit